MKTPTPNPRHKGLMMSDKFQMIKKAPNVKYKSDFVLLDVKSGRRSLAKMFGLNGYPEVCGSVRIPVTIKGYITHRHGGDDGVSIEYGVEVESLKIAGGK